MAAKLSALFASRQVEKRYRAHIEGHFEAQQLPLRITSSLDGKEAISEIELHQAAESHSIVDVRIETGRKHQIRRHLAALGHPVLGDRLYGTATADSEDLKLTAYLLGFHCPVLGKPMTYRLKDY